MREKLINTIYHFSKKTPLNDKQWLDLCKLPETRLLDIVISILNKQTTEINHLKTNMK